MHPTHWLLSTQRDALEDGERVQRRRHEEHLLRAQQPQLVGRLVVLERCPRRDVPIYIIHMHLDPQSANGQRDLCANQTVSRVP